jgi:hypothetical protein
MQTQTLQHKDEAILDILRFITAVFGKGVFTLTDIWAGDNCALGLKRKNKLIYISTWGYRDRPLEEMRYYAEFELINEKTLETLSIEEVVDGVDREILVKEIEQFIGES